MSKSTSDNERPLWLVGTGNIAREYAKILTSLHYPYVAIGRGQKNADQFLKETQTTPFVGGLEKFLREKPEPPTSAIVGVGVDKLFEVTAKLSQTGVKRILVEKPAGLNPAEVRDLQGICQENHTQVYVAYNRRFYNSVRQAKLAIQEDGGPTSFHFDFTEWSHVVANLDLPSAVKENWLLANSSHLIDLAFFLGGAPSKLTALSTGKLPWHPSGSIFVGHGVSDSTVPFSYHADWSAPGRWGVDIMTTRRRFILRPLEKLQVQQTGSIDITSLPESDDWDSRFKPGLARMTQWFLNEGKGEQLSALPSLEEHTNHMERYETILRGSL